LTGAGNFEKHLIRFPGGFDGLTTCHVEEEDDNAVGDDNYCSVDKAYRKNKSVRQTLSTSEQRENADRHLSHLFE
jgi:hypothetical protein